MKTTKTVVIIGACGVLAHETARKVNRLCEARFLLVARSKDQLNRVKADLFAHGAKNVELIEAEDLADTESHLVLMQRIKTHAPVIDYLLLAYGVMYEQQKTEQDFVIAAKEIHINFTSYISWLIHFSSFFKQQGFGTIGIISSVAGDLARKKNFAYASSKAGLSLYAQGLGASLKPYGVRVLLIKPGIIKTPLSLPFINPNSPLVTSGDLAGSIIAKHLVLQQSTEIYVPNFWCYILFILRCLPRRLIDKMNI